MGEVFDLRKVPLNTLTSQQIRSRLALIHDTMIEMAKEIDELNAMQKVLSSELQLRDKGNKNVTNLSSGDSSRS